MNPETGRIEQVMGTTWDGYDVFKPYRLRFLPMCFARHGSLLYLAVEFNRDERNRRRPYYVLHIATLVFTGGWLFDSAASSGAAESADQKGGEK